MGVDPRFLPQLKDLRKPVGTNTGMGANAPIVVDGHLGACEAFSFVPHPAFELVIGKPIFEWAPSQ